MQKWKGLERKKNVMYAKMFSLHFLFCTGKLLFQIWLSYSPNGGANSFGVTNYLFFFILLNVSEMCTMQSIYPIRAN